MGQKRWKSPVLWVSLVALVLGVLVAGEVITTTQNEAINALVPYLLNALAAFGVINNPTSKDTL